MRLTGRGEAYYSRGRSPDVEGCEREHPGASCICRESCVYAASAVVKAELYYELALAQQDR